MKQLTMILSIGLLFFLAFSPFGCNKEAEYPHKMSLDEANKVLKAPLPVPAYLPDDFVTTEIYLLEHNDELEHIVITISNSNTVVQGSALTDIEKAPIKMYVKLLRRGQVGGLKLVGEVFDIAGTRGVLVTRDKTNDLWWILPYRKPPGQYELHLTAVNKIPKEELVKIATSVPH